MPNPSEVQGYILEEQKNTKFDLIKKVRSMSEEKYNDILIEFDGRFVDQQNFLYIQSMSEILDNTYQENKNTQQAVKAMYQIKELIILSKIDLKTINESKM